MPPDHSYRNRNIIINPTVLISTPASTVSAVATRPPTRTTIPKDEHHGRDDPPTTADPIDRKHWPRNSGRPDGDRFSFVQPALLVRNARCGVGDPLRV